MRARRGSGDERPPTTVDCAVWQSTSLLLGYPDEALIERIALIDAVAHELPPRFGEPLRAVTSWLRAIPLDEVQAAYVATFDLRRRGSLFLTYFTQGDTRRRGVSLLRFKQTYLRSGFVLDAQELPDHLCVVLEFAATIDAAGGRRLLLDHRAGVELLRIALQEAASPWAAAAAAVCATLPPLHGDEEDAIARLAAEGPPAEEVGIDPYRGPAFDPMEGAPRKVEPLPFPVVRASRS
jgi:nitrate reductase delta subunit